MGLDRESHFSVFTKGLYIVSVDSELSFHKLLRNVNGITGNLLRCVGGTANNNVK